LGTCGGPLDHGKFFFENVLILASFDAEFNADCEYQIEILKNLILV
jgi:hypothetical protein